MVYTTYQTATEGVVTDTLERPDKQLREPIEIPDEVNKDLQAMQQQRERVQKARDDVQRQMDELQTKLDAYNRQLSAYTAFELIVQGKMAPPEPQPIGRAATKPSEEDTEGEKPKRTRQPRGTGTSVREQVLEIFRKSDRPLTAVDVIGLMNADDKMANNIRQAFTKLKEKKLIRQEKDRGPYTVVPGSENASANDGEAS
jgi:hypothetical protein